MTAGSGFPIWAIIPAAGLSRRMGRPKLTLPHRGSTLAGIVAKTVLDAGVAELIVVTRTELLDSLGLPADERVRVAINDDPASEMIDSIRIGLDQIDAGPPRRRGADDPASTTGVMVVPADMPAISAEVCRQCMAVFQSDPQRIVVASHSGTRGHPIIFPFSLKGAVDRLEDGLRELLRAYAERVVRVDCSEPGVIEDVDEPSDYEQLDRG